MPRSYRVVLSKTQGGLAAVAGEEWTILDSTVRDFAELDSDHDHSFTSQKVGRLLLREQGFIALAFKDSED